MTVRYYSSVAAETTLVGSITNANTSIELQSVTGLPILYPYTLALDYESATEELVEVSAAAGTTLTVTRAIDGTSAAAHNSGARVRHVSSARDFADSRTHENSTTNIHGLGVGEAIVGTTGTQTLLNKTLDDPVINDAVFAGTFSGNYSHNGDVNFLQDVDIAGFAEMADGLVVGTTLDVGGIATFDDEVHNSNLVRSNRIDPTDSAFETRATGDANARWFIREDGRMFWGSGAAVQDLTVFRSAPNTLSLNGGTLAAGPVTSTTLSATTSTSFPLETVAGSITPGAGFNLAFSHVRKIAGLITIAVGLARTGGTITADAAGNITDLTICTLPAAMRPNTLFSPDDLTFACTTGIGGGWGFLDSSGIATLVGWASNGTIVNGNVVRFYMSYPAP